jgi:RHH-type proline utilization regulon transcriptional repressor/proline dehydrogenase/delta 1-pyrroline-5-carboxylate dehydrogenase
VRRLLENGANSSFVHQIVDESISPEDVARDPFDALATAKAPASLLTPQRLFADRENSIGFDQSDEGTLARIEGARANHGTAAALTVRPATGTVHPVTNPATGAKIGEVMHCDAATVTRALEDARAWDAPAAERAATLRRAADLYEAHYGEIFATLTREAGKSLPDAIGELREAVDFLRYYAAEGEHATGTARGIIGAISPWNFPLAIFSGQIAAALMAGNAVIAKPAEPTPIIAAIGVRLLHQAGVPAAALQLIPGRGSVIGTALASDPRVKGLVFTGSTATAQTIARNMAANLTPGTPLIAETGGLNAMIVDSTALPEQAVRDVVNSAFRSAGQRCSALRCLYVQEDIAPHVIEMIKGAMNELVVGDPWAFSTDVGPVIDTRAQSTIADYLTEHRSRILHQLAAPAQGTFIPPTMLPGERDRGS